MDVRKVSTRGAISISSKMHFLGEALVNEYVGLKKCENGEMEVYYGPIYLGKFANGHFEKPILTRKHQKCFFMAVFSLSFGLQNPKICILRFCVWLL
jgi:hypothetical protein